MTTRRQCIAAAALSIIAPRAVAQAAKSIPKIGVLRWDGGQVEARRKSLVRALRERGYTEGKNIIPPFVLDRANEVIR